MKKLFFLFFNMLATLSYSGNAIGQDKPAIKIVSEKQNGNTVDITLKSSKRFVAGAKFYILYIGDKEFALSKDQSYYKGKGSITFLVPAADFSSLMEGTNVYLSYGHQFKGSENRDETVKYNDGCWSLGKFSKKILTK
jgi:hypothetical protein